MNRLLRPVAAILATCVAATVLVLWARAYSVSSRDIDLLGANLAWWTLPLLLALLAVHVGAAALRWSRIEQALGAERPQFQRAFTSGAIALGVGTFLPSFLTNIAARAISNRLSGDNAVRGAVSGTLDQLADLAVVVLFVPAAILGVFQQSLPLYLIAVVFSGCLGFLSLSVAPSLTGALARIAAARHLSEASRRLWGRDVLLPIYMLSLLRFFCLTAITLLIHFATGAATVSATVIAIPLVTLAISLAMLPGGLGVSEWSFSAVFAVMGVEHGAIVLFVLGNRILLSLMALLLMALTLGHAAGVKFKLRRPGSQPPRAEPRPVQ